MTELQLQRGVTTKTQKAVITDESDSTQRSEWNFLFPLRSFSPERGNVWQCLTFHMMNCTSTVHIEDQQAIIIGSTLSFTLCYILYRDLGRLRFFRILWLAWTSFCATKQRTWQRRRSSWCWTSLLLLCCRESNQLLQQMGFLFQIHHVVTVIEENKVFVDNRSTAEKTLNLTQIWVLSNQKY